MEKFDIAIIGGGPGGYSSAILAAQAGKRVVLFEKERLGGTCLNVGCIPTKSLIEKASLLTKIRRWEKSGFLKQTGYFSFKKAQESKAETVNTLVGGVGYILKSYGVTVVSGSAVLQKGPVVCCDGKEYAAENVLIATGSKAFVPKIKGLDGEVLFSTGALALESIPSSMVIIGGGVIGVEMACIFNAFRSKVTIVEMLGHILATEDDDVSQTLENELKEAGITLCTGAEVKEILPAPGGKEVIIQAGGKEERLFAEKVLCAIGRVANTEGIDCAALGIETDKRGNILVDRFMRTAAKGIYACGDVVGGYQLAHSAYMEGETAIRNILGQKQSYDDSVMPRCVYSFPQIASVGRTEKELKTAKIAYTASKFALSGNGKALAGGEKAGFVKTIVDTEGKLIGVSVVGAEATELISQAVLMLNYGAYAKDFLKIIYPHPTISECMKESALMTAGCAVHVPKGKQ